MLRQASAHESRGELKEAEATLRELLEAHSGSVAAVLALERVLRADGRVAEALSVFDRYVAEYPQTSQVWRHKLGVLAEVDSLAGVETTVENWIRACDRILEMQPRVIVPGHGPLTDAAGVQPGEELETRLARGSLVSRVTEVRTEQEADEA